MSKFKAGDLVYYPNMGGEVFKLKGSLGSDTYPVCIYLDYGDDYKVIPFTSTGFMSATYKLPQIFHATPEMKAKLEEFYGVEFKEPPPKPTSSEIIKAKLVIEKLPVPCWVSNTNEQPSSSDKWVFIERVLDGDRSFLGTEYCRWKFATPFNYATGQPITEMPE